MKSHMKEVCWEKSSIEEARKAGRYTLGVQGASQRKQHHREAPENEDHPKAEYCP